MFTPPIHRCMKVLQRDAFNKSFQLLAVSVPAKQVGSLRQQLAKELFNQPRLRNVLPGPTAEQRYLLLRVDITAPEQLSSESRQLISESGYPLEPYTLKVDYDYWSTEEILTAVLPEDMLIPGAFETIGHIAHMNLRDECLPYKHIIGQVVLDKNPRIKSVVNKTDSIDTTFRFFKMEVLAGIDDMVAEVRESGCRFRFDFSKVYWNSRLHTEHDRLLRLFRPNERVCDAFAGVGPFAVPAAKRGHIVYANDLNPASYQYLCENGTLNRVKQLKCYNLDGREFIRQAFEDLCRADRAANRPFRPFEHVAMNLPATALEFLDAFRGLLADHETAMEVADNNNDDADNPLTNITVHCYCFSKSDDPAQDVVQRAGEMLQEPLAPNTYSVFDVRRVAPHKVMLCLSFRLAKSVAFNRPINEFRKRKDSTTTDGDDNHSSSTLLANSSEDTKRARIESDS